MPKLRAMELVWAAGLVVFWAAAPPVASSGDVPDDAVRFDLVEPIPEQRAWEFDVSAPASESFTQSLFALTGLPRKYSPRGVMVERANPLLLRAVSRVTLPAGEYRFLLRSHNAARLFMDGELLAQTPFLEANSDGHEPVPEIVQLDEPLLRPMKMGHEQRVVSRAVDGQPHVYRLEVIVGGKKLRPEIGELVVAVSAGGAAFQVLGPGKLLPLTDAGWESLAVELRQQMEDRNRSARSKARSADDAYWSWRHDLARRMREADKLPEPPHIPGSDNGATSTIDRFILARLNAAGVKPAPLADDYTFLARVTLDTIGLRPSEPQIREFVSDRSPSRRARVIDNLLADPRWADHWIPYWQDVLAENPGILKPELNNTGPFRWWLEESFQDNKPLDRMVTELVMAEGSVYGGGTAGFALATQNDAPWAAKAHILGTAFLGVEMKCARCHDAPFHEHTQKDLFQLAGMLKRGAQAVPAGSTVPGVAAGQSRGLVTVSLAAGSAIEPAWPFPDLAGPWSERPAELLRNPSDAREELAARITWPGNRRFPQVMVNRLWKRYLGWGLMEPVDDWENAQSSHPELLEYLAHELVTRDYDLKHVARMILNSQVYQRAVLSGPGSVPGSEQRLFAAAARRRLSAEQLLDSLFAAVGKPLGCEELNLDPDGRRPIESFLNLGTPRRGWEFASLSNERDRPSLAMPVAQSIVDLLSTFNWRETRQVPLSVRDETATVLQPLMLAHGTVVHRVTTLSDDSQITALCLEDQPLETLIERVYLRVLSRPPESAERELFVELLSEGYQGRVVGRLARPAPQATPRHAVSWSNHLSEEANRIKLELERAARMGDPPTTSLAPAWRERMEDMLWALVNSPEYLFVP